MTTESMRGALNRAIDGDTDPHVLDTIALIMIQLDALDRRLQALERAGSEVMTLDEVAALLDVHIETVRRYYGRERDPLPVHRPSERSLMFLRSEVLAWLAQQ